MNSGAGDLSLDMALGLVKQFCSKEHIQHLLRKTKKDTPDKGVVRISGSLEQVVQQNLRDAIQTGAIPLEAVYELIERCEESGKKHIF